MNLIKSSIYKLNNVVARFTGTYNEAGEPIFSNHGTPIAFDWGTLEKASADDIKAYFSK